MVGMIQKKKKKKKKNRNGYLRRSPASLTLIMYIIGMEQLCVMRLCEKFRWAKETTKQIKIQSLWKHMSDQSSNESADSVLILKYI